MHHVHDFGTPMQELLKELHCSGNLFLYYESLRMRFSMFAKQFVT